MKPHHRPYNHQNMCSHLLPVLLLLLVTGVIVCIPLDMASARSCQCTYFVYRQRPDIEPGMGDAKNWITSAELRGYEHGGYPHVGDVAVFPAGEQGFSENYGHVGIVIGVNRNHDRFDIIGWDGLKNDCRIQIITNLSVTENTQFIHSIK